ncbi:IS30 family transposase [Bradyrhizobium sp. LB7.2]
MKPAEPVTPWQRVYVKFGMSQSEFARALDRHRSKVSRALKDGKGLISGRDQEAILAAARDCKVAITADDMMPVR